MTPKFEDMSEWERAQVKRDLKKMCKAIKAQPPKDSEVKGWRDGDWFAIPADEKVKDDPENGKRD